jgi:hypothetical protein
MTQKGHSESSLDLRIDELIGVSDASVTEGKSVERRVKPRLKEAFPARVWGIDSRNLPFNVDCVLDNISSTGLYLRMTRPVDVGSEVRLIVHLLQGPSTGATAAIQGKILRSELHADGKHGLAIAISKHRFL